MPGFCAFPWGQFNIGPRQNGPKARYPVDTDTWPYQGVTLRGSATVAGAEELAHEDFIEHLSVAYLGEDTGRPLGRYIAGMEGEHVILVLQPDTWHTFDYS